MKMMRWFLRLASLLLITLLVIGSPPVRAATAFSPSSECDEHPWDTIKRAYKVEILVITSDYILFAVWFTKEQVTPVIIRVDLRSKSVVVGSQKTNSKNSFIIIE